jgi:hypothetical protein
MIDRERFGSFRVQCSIGAVDHLPWMCSRVNLELRLWAALEVLAGRLERQA